MIGISRQQLLELFRWLKNENYTRSGHCQRSGLFFEALLIYLNKWLWRHNEHLGYNYGTLIDIHDIDLHIVNCYKDWRSKKRQLILGKVTMQSAIHVEKRHVTVRKLKVEQLALSQTHIKISSNQLYVYMNPKPKISNNATIDFNLI